MGVKRNGFLIGQNKVNNTYIDGGKTKIHQRSSHNEEVKSVPWITEIILNKLRLNIFGSKVKYFSP